MELARSSLAAQMAHIHARHAGRVPLPGSLDIRAGHCYHRELIMEKAIYPSKYLARKDRERRSQEVKPPPAPEEIRRQLGWGLLLFDRKINDASRS